MDIDFLTCAKGCENCKYFYRHYILKRGKYLSVNCGHCAKKSIADNEQLRLCYHWQAQEITVEEETKRDIKLIIEEMSARLNVLSELLSDD